MVIYNRTFWTDGEQPYVTADPLNNIETGISALVDELNYHETSSILPHMDGCVTNSKIAALAITADKIALNSISNALMATNAINTINIIDGAITASKILDGSISSSKIASAAIMNLHLSAGAVSNTAIMDGAITTSKIADYAITSSKLAVGSISLSKLGPDVTLFIQNNGMIGAVNSNKGTITFNGTGSQTNFTVAHGLSSTPNYWMVTPTSAAAGSNHYTTVSTTSITITFLVAPAAGTGNIGFNWFASL